MDNQLSIEIQEQDTHTTGINAIAQQIAAAIERQQDKSGAQTDEQMIGLFISTRTAQTTKDAYRRTINTFMEYVNKPLRKVTVMDINDYKQWIDGQDIKPNTKRNKLMPVKALFTYANKIGYLQFNVAAAVEVKAVDRSIHDKVIKVNDVLRIFDNLENQTHKLMVNILYASGGRVTEFINLKWKDADIENGVLYFTVTKSGKIRAVPIKAEVVELLKSHKAETDAPTGKGDYIFQSKYRGEYRQYSRFAINAFLNRLGDKLGVKITPHMFRHSIAKHSAKKGVGIATIRDRLGHSSIAVTNIYLQGDDGVTLDSDVWG